MAGSIAPNTPQAPGALNIKQTPVDFSAFGKMGDAQIQSAAQNYKLYAQTSWAQMSQAAFRNNSTNPVALGVALKDIATKILPDDMPEDLRNNMTASFYLDSLALASKAQKNQDDARDLQNQEMAQANIANLLDRYEDNYVGVLNYNKSPGEEKRPIDVEIFNKDAMEIMKMSQLRDTSGKPVFSESQRKEFASLQGRKLNGFQKFFDRMLLESPDEAKDYYTKFMLNSEEYMGQSAMDRRTYTKSLDYAKGELKRVGEDMKNPVFNRSNYETAKLQTAYLDNKIERWQENGLINKDVATVLKSSDVTTDPIDIRNQATFLHGLNAAQEIIMNGAEDENGNSARFQAYTTALQSMGQGFDKKLDDDEKKGLITLYSRALVDKEFATALQPLFSDSALHDQLYGTMKENASLSKDNIGTPQGFMDSFNKSKQESGRMMAGFTANRASALAEESANNVALSYAQAALQAAASGQPQRAQELLQAGNRATIRTRAQNQIPPAEFDRLELNLKNGIPAIYNKNYLFRGYDNKNAIFERKI